MNKKIFGMALSASVLALCPTLGNALVVTVEPDDFTLGADISSASPYVDLRAVYNLESQAVRASASNLGASGQLTFGSHSIGCRRDPCGANDHDGFGMFFSQDVSGVTLQALNWGYEYGLPASWVAFDQFGAELAFGYTPALAVGQSAEIQILGQGIRSVIVGGFSGISAIEFDRLSFNVADPVHVPEPATLGLFGLGLAFFGLQVRRKT